MPTPLRQDQSRRQSYASVQAEGAQEEEEGEEFAQEYEGDPFEEQRAMGLTPAPRRTRVTEPTPLTSGVKRAIQSRRQSYAT
jgi:hypothetical protein